MPGREESLLQDLEDHDWDVIKSAAESKYARLQARVYGNESVAGEWRKQMARAAKIVADLLPELPA